MKYGQSKLANILYTRELARRYPEITAVAIHPGTVKTGLTETTKKSFLLAKILAPIVMFATGVGVEKGVLNQLWAATDTGVRSGEYYVPVGDKSRDSEMSKDMELAEKLWNWTEDELADTKYKL